GFLPGAMARNLGSIPAAAHAAPFALAGAGGVLEDPAALRVVANPQPSRIALDQLAGDGFREPCDRAVNGIALVAVIQGYAVRRRDQLVDVVSAQRPVALIP